MRHVWTGLGLCLTLTLTLSLTLTLTLTLTPSPARADDKGGATASLVGGYTIVSGEREGAPEPEERIKGSIVRFSEDRVVVTDPQSKEIYGASYTIDASQTPWKITLVSKLAPKEGETARGLIEKKGDTVRLIYALPGGDVPTDFKTKDRQLMFVLKNRNK